MRFYIRQWFIANGRSAIAKRKAQGFVSKNLNFRFQASFSATKDSVGIQVRKREEKLIKNMINKLEWSGRRPFRCPLWPLKSIPIINFEFENLQREILLGLSSLSAGAWTLNESLLLERSWLLESDKFSNSLPLWGDLSARTFVFSERVTTKLRNGRADIDKRRATLIEQLN